MQHLITRIRGIFYAAALLVAMPAFAQSLGDQGPPLGDQGTGGQVITNPLGGISDLPTLLNAILKFVATELGPVIVTLMLVYCGFLFVVAQGNDEKLRDARTALLWTVIGALILLGAAALQSVITATVNGLGTS